MRRRVFILAPLAALVAAACGGGKPTTPAGRPPSGSLAPAGDANAAGGRLPTVHWIHAST